MQEIKYELDNGMYVKTPCPYIEGKKIPTGCETCDFFFRRK
jgi:hypothetical protein